MYGQVLLTKNLISSTDEVDLPKVIGKKLTFKELQVTCTCASLHDVFYWKLGHMNSWQHSAVPKVRDFVHTCTTIYMHVHNL